MPRKLRKSFVGHPSAILFLLISRVGLFQHPQAITPTTGLLANRRSTPTTKGSISSSLQLLTARDEYFSIPLPFAQLQKLARESADLWHRRDSDSGRSWLS